MARRAPRVFSSVSTGIIFSGSPMSTLSVISSSSQRGASPEATRASDTWATTSLSWNWMADKFTAMSRFSPDSSSQARAWRQASFRAQAPMGTISRVSSARGMKLSGITSPSSGCCQRIRASTPTTRPVSRSTWGW